MTIDKQKLKALAEAAGMAHGWYQETSFGLRGVSGRSEQAFIAAASPATIMALLAEIERLEAESRDAKDAKVGLGWAVNELRSSFKNFHRSLCARFGYTHDEKDWFRDQVSLEEHVAGQIDQLKAENDALRSGLAIRRLTCAEVREAFNQAYYQPREIGSDGEQCRAGVLAVIDAAMAKEASHDR